MTLEEKENILIKPCLTVEDVMIYTNFSKSHSYKIMSICRKEFNGKAGLRSEAIKTESLMQYLGTTLERELTLLAILKGNTTYNGQSQETLQERNI